ncbi:MAG: arginine--tRNA ligase [Planctomycetales bacterium]|nr:arginine--tRNA ligase [Planctomycetales bacterium]
MNVLQELRSRFRDALASLVADPVPFAEMVKAAQDSKFGDYQANCAMPLAKLRGENPRDVAGKIIAQLKLDDLCDPPEIAGPGFINLKLRQDWLEATVTRLVTDPRLSVHTPSRSKTIVIDFSGPNIAKPMHVGHLRSTVIGDALRKILTFQGHRVIGDNHIGDWGTQFGMILYGFKNFLDREAYSRTPVAELARQYRLVNQLGDYHEAAAGLPGWRSQLAERQRALQETETTSPATPVEKDARKKQLKRLNDEVAGLRDQVASGEKKLAAVDSDATLKLLALAHPNIATLAREETAKLHTGDAENRRLWEQFMPACLAELQKMYDRLDVRFDIALGESFYQPLLAAVVTDLQSRGLARESDGAICVFIPGVDAPFIVRKTDGAFTYATTDLATIQYRVRELHADTILYVVDARQSDHFKLLFESARRWGFDQIELHHVSFGTILGDDKRPFKTRAGDTVGLESLLNEGVAKARGMLETTSADFSSRPDLTESQRQIVAAAVGLGAIKYADLSQNRESDYVFSWDKMLATNGDTSTYMQYAYARVCGIFRKGNFDRTAIRAAGGSVSLATPAERALALQLLRFAEAIDSAAAEYRPNFLTQYLFATANCFSTFFEQCPVVKADTDDLRASRLRLCDLTARVIAQGLELLGIQTIEQM